MSNYIALIHKDSDSDYGISFPDLPGCVSAGIDLEDARAMAEEALALHLTGMLDDGYTIPEPSSLDVVMSDPDHHGAVAILVEAPLLQANAVRVALTIPEADLQAIDAKAQERGLTRAAFLLSAAKAAIEPAPA